MSKAFLVILVLLFLGFSASAQQEERSEVPQAQPSTEYKIPAEAVQKVNPTKPTPESIAKGKKLYGYDCAMCHGENGDGRGDLAKGMKPAVPDFRDSAVLKERTDGELFYIMKNGKGEMPPENRGNDNALWDLVNYIRSFATKVSVSPPGTKSGPPQESH
jgi:mono/diheme cytochrome c family protein